MSSVCYQLHNIQFYYAQQLALSLENLSIADGKMTALLGDNGSGKSTLLNILAFLNVVDSGELVYKAQPVKASTLINLRRRVGLLPQKPFMLKGTVYDNINLGLTLQGKKQRTQKIKQVLQRLDIAAIAKQQANLLSGGQLQKVALARILVLEPEVLLLDEPFSYLDQQAAQQLEDFLRGYCTETGQTLIFSTHNRLQGFALADKVISLSQGRQVMSPLINLFQGQIHQHIFECHQLRIILPEADYVGQHVSIDPQDIVLSADKIISSMRNQFQGRVIMIADENGRAYVKVDVGQVFQVLITYQALMELKLELGKAVWIHFKSNAVVVF